MNRFVARFTDEITGILSGFDRLVFRGTVRNLTWPDGLRRFLAFRRIPYVGFGDFAEASTKRLIDASQAAAKQQGRYMEFLRSSQVRKDELARQVAARDGITEGLICVFEAVEPCKSFDIFRNREKKKLELVPRFRKCKHLYHYWIDRLFGFMSARIQTWFPFNIQVCMNGREWLARSMDGAGIAYRRDRNCFPWIEDFDRAQRLMDRQLQTDWLKELPRIARVVNPIGWDIFGKARADFRGDYYWSVHQSEWATDLVFRDRETLERIYRSLLLYGITTFSAEDVMTFLGRKLNANFEGEVIGDLKKRPEGFRLKHSIDWNSLKLYLKGVEANLLRFEATINQAKAFRVFRPKEGDPEGPCALRTLRQGVVDLKRRAEISQAANERYQDALGAAETQRPVGDTLRQVCKRTTKSGRPFRGLRPWTEEDKSLIEAVSREELDLQGFRNRDLQPYLYTKAVETPEDQRRRTAQVGRRIAMLRAHGLVKKLPHSRRYRVTPEGREVFAAILLAHRVTLEKLRAAAA